MGLSIDGNNITITGTFTLVNGFDPTTGVAFLVITPDGGFGTLPFGAQGSPGLSPTLNFEVIEVDPDDPLPTPNPVVTLVDEGDPGQRSEYDITIYVHSGSEGPSGTFAVLDATDIDGTVNDDYILAKTVGADTVTFIPQRVGDHYVPGAINSTSGSSTSRPLTSVSIPGQPFDWRPRCFGQCVVSGTVNTRVDLVARIGHQTDGQQVGYAYGIAGASPPTLTMIPAAPTGSNMPGDYGRVAAGATAIIYFLAEQKAPTLDAWTTSNTSTSFWVEVAPILTTTTGS